MNERGLVFFGEQLHDDAVLLRGIHARPSGAKVLFLAQGGAAGVTFEFGAFVVFKVELAGKAQQLLDLGEGDLGFGFQRLHDLVALGCGEWLLGQAFADQAQVVDLLVDAKALLAGQGQGCAFFFGHERAAARFDGLERALVQQTVFEFGAGGFVKLGGIEFGLFGPQGVELDLDHGAVNVEVVALFDFGLAVVSRDAVFAVTRPDGQTFLVAGKQPLAHGAAASDLHGFAQLPNGFFECAAVVFFLVGFAVALEAPALVDVEQGAGKFGGLQGMIQTFGAQCQRLQPFQDFARRFILRKKAMRQKRFHHPGLALEQAVAAAAHGTRFASTDSQR